MNCINLTHERKSAKRLGMTLVESLMGVGLSSLVLTGLMFVFLTSNRSFIATQFFRRPSARG